MERWSQEDLESAKAFKELSQKWELPLLFADVVILTIEDQTLKVLLTQRQTAPEKGKWALAGVMVNPTIDSSTEAAALRAVKEKTSTIAPYTEQLRNFSGPDRDPRGWSSSNAYICLMPLKDIGTSAFKLHQTKLVDVDAAIRMPLAFDHGAILTAGLERVRNKVNYSALPAYLLEEKFTLTELMNAYETVLGQELDKSAFRKKIAEAGFVKMVPGEKRTGPNRPAQIFELDKSVPLPTLRRNLTP